MKTLLTTLNSKYIHTALSLRYIKAYVDKHSDHKSQIREYTINQDINHILGDIYRGDFDIVAFSVYIWNANTIYDLVKSIKLVSPNTKVVLGGPEVSFDIEELMTKIPQIDYIVAGEGEIAFLELLDAIENKSTLSQVSNLAYRLDDKIEINTCKDQIVDLDHIPEVYGNDLEEYENKIIYYESSRGCPFNCKFCLSSTISGVRYFSLDRVKKDIKKFLDARVKQVKFIDRTFNAKKDHAMTIMKYILQNDNGYTNFHFEVTAHLIDGEMMEFLASAPSGLFQFEIGVQSTNTQTIEGINRTTDFEKLAQVVREIKRGENIHLHLDLIAGLPYENYQSFKKSFDHVYGLKPEKLQLGFLKLLRGSKMRAEEEHEFKYLNKPPYEILENKYMTYSEILKLKDIEELVDIYGNEYRFKNSMNYIMDKYYDSYFEFYEEFSDYWRANKLYESSHGKTSQYKIIYDFFGEKFADYIDDFREIIRYDFIGDTKSPNVPAFMKIKDQLDKNDKYKLLKSESLRSDIFSEIDEREYNNIHKFVYIDKFIYNIEGKTDCEKVYLFDYRVSERELKKSNIVDISKYWRDLNV